MAFSRVKYNGVTPGANGNTTVLFATILPAAPTDVQNANLSECFFALTGVRKLNLVLKHSHLGTLKAYASDDRGVNWRQVDEVAIATPAAATGSDPVEFLVESFRDFKLEWVNGGTTQNPWMVNLSFSDDRASAI